MHVRFTVPGEPRGKGRPRFARIGNYVRTYSSAETVTYENLIKMEFQNQCGMCFFGKDVPIEMVVVAYYGIPRSASKKKVTKMLSGEIRPLKKVDSSNLLKAIEDALNTVAYHDDVQIVETKVSRFYGEMPRVEVMIREIESEKVTIDKSKKM